MNFLAPFALWFAAVIPVVILFYLLKRKRVVRLVSSTILWQKFLAETQASAPFQKLRHNWLLILQILMLLLAILALARPYFSGKSEGGRLYVVILDASASMQSTDESPSRFERARGEALRLVDAMHRTDEMVVLQAGANTEVKQSPTGEKAVLRRAIQRAKPADTPTRLREALKLAETLIRPQAKAEIHLFSDGAVSGLDEFENSNLPLVYHRFGRRGENVGVINLDVRPHPEDVTRRAVLANVGNFSTNAQNVQLEFRFEGQVLEVKALTLSPGETSPQVFSAKQDRDGIFSVRLMGNDDLAVDDEAAMPSLMPRPARVLLVTAGNGLLEKALRVLPNVILTVQGTLANAAADYDLVVLDNLSPAVWPSGNVLAIRSAAPEWFETVTPLEGPPIVDWKHGHPLLRSVNFDNVLIAEALGVKTPSWAVALVESPQSPLILAGELGRQRIVWIGFDTLQSTWPLRVSFPIFLANAVDWLNPSTVNSSLLMVQAGSPFRMGLTEPLARAEVELPDGTVRALEVNPERGELVFGETLSKGVYRLNAGTNAVTFCVNLLDPRESDTAPRAELKMGKFATVEATQLLPASLEIWRWIAGAALLVLMFEWWYYHRRTV